MRGWRASWRGRLAAAVAAGWLGAGSWEAAAQRPPDADPSRDAPAPATVHDWLEREHQFLRRYKGVALQAAHDYQYGYKTPASLLPVLVELFVIRVAHAHAVEEQVLYPVLRSHLTPERQRILRLVEHDQESEREAIRRLQRELADPRSSRGVQEIARLCNDLARALNRHIVFHEEHFYPVIDALPAEEARQLRQDLLRGEAERFGPDGRRGSEALLVYIEGEIDRVAGRIW